MNRFMKLLFVAAAATQMSGCAWLNPYEEKTMCAALDDFGQCVTVKEAYESAFIQEDVAPDDLVVYENEDNLEIEDDDPTDYTLNPRSRPKKKTKASKVKTRKPINKDELTYRQQLYREMSSLLEDPKTPMVKPPKIRRILVTPYDDGSDVLYMPRYVFVVIDRGTWVLDEYQNPTRNTPSIELFNKIEK